MIKNPSNSATFRAIEKAMKSELGNRCSIRLSYGGTGGFPSFPGVSGQCDKRETREGARFQSAQTWAQSVHLPFPAYLNQVAECAA